MSDNRITYGEWRKAWQLKVILGHYHETYEESPRIQSMYVRLWPDSVDIKFLRPDYNSPKVEYMLEQVVSFKTAEYIVSWEPELSSPDTQEGAVDVGDTEVW